MAWVKMLIAVSGGRPDGSVWPNPWTTDGLLECSDAEAADLIGAQIAVRAQAPPKPAEEPVKSVTVAAPAEEPEPEPEPEPESSAVEHLEPAPYDPKPAWVEWAVHNGADRDEAMKMTKADLQAAYGGRL